MVMALAKRVPSAVRYQDRRKWAMETMWNERPRPRELARLNHGAGSLGSIGAEIASMSSALKMHVIGIRGAPGAAAPKEHKK